MTIKQIDPEDVRVTVPDEIESAHKTLQDAQKAYQKALEDHAPTCVLQKGDLVIVDRHKNDSAIYGKVVSVEYRPHSVWSWHGYSIQISPYTKHWKRAHMRRRWFWLNASANLKLKTD